MEDFTGQYVGRYCITGTLGEGGMATVFKAFDERLQREVAIKIIRRSAVPPEQWDTMLKRFEREAISLAKLTHPNIVPVIDYGEFQNSPYLVMVYLQGDSLKSRIGQKISHIQAARWLMPIARALNYAHRSNLIHRDVKPGNILFTEDGEPMLSDFGIAKILDTKESTSLTGTGVGVGTPKYMAPEQWLSQVLPQSDQYALGVVLFEIVTGRPPYDGDSTTAILVKQTTEPQPRPKDFVPDLPDQVEQIILKAMAKEPEARYKDMGAFADALEAIKNLRQGEETSRAAEEIERLQSTIVQLKINTVNNPSFGLETVQQIDPTPKPPLVVQTDNSPVISTPSPDVQSEALISEQAKPAERPISHKTIMGIDGKELTAKSSEKSQENWAISLPVLLGGAVVLGILVVILILVLFGSKLTF